MYPYYQYGIEFRRTDTALVFFAGDPQGELHQSAALAIATPDVLRHYAFTYDGTTLRAYLDGIEYSNVSTTAPLVSRDTPLLIGTDGRSSQGLHGALDNLRIYRRALDAAEIVADMNLATLDSR